MTHTFTRTHVYITFANPYLVCSECLQRATGFHDGERCGCDDGYWLMPCEHRHSGALDICASWGPVDGCTCMEAFGEIPHDANVEKLRAKPKDQR